MSKVLIDRAVVEKALKSWEQARGALAYVAVGNAPSNPSLARSTCSQAVWVLDNAEPALRAALEQQQVGEVVITTNQQGQCVAVTRQDDEGQILSVIWQAEQPQVEQEPVAWQRRMRTKWMRDGEWWPWQECSQAVADEYKQAPVVNDWEYESRALYTHPQPPRQPLTLDQILDAIRPAWSDPTCTLEHVVRAIERAHGIGGEA